LLIDNRLAAESPVTTGQGCGGRKENLRIGQRNIVGRRRPQACGVDEQADRRDHHEPIGARRRASPQRAAIF
jgi:hypothetical protein